MNLLETECIKTNSLWHPIDVITVWKAFSDASAGAAKLFYCADGYPVPKTLEEWLELPVGVDDDFVTTGGHYHGEIRKVLVPRVEIAINYNGRPIPKDQKPTLDNLYRRYKGKDAVTGKPLKREHASREHVIPRFHGGGNDWDNLVPRHRKGNSKRGHKSFAEAGEPEPKILGAPPPLLPINMIINKHNYKEWDLFGIPRPNNETR